MEEIPVLLSPKQLLGKFHKILVKNSWMSPSHPNVHNFDNNSTDIDISSLKPLSGDSEIKYSDLKVIELSVTGLTAIKENLLKSNVDPAWTEFFSLIANKNAIIVENYKVIFKEGKRSRVIDCIQLYDYFLLDNSGEAEKNSPPQSKRAKFFDENTSSLTNCLSVDADGIRFLPGHGFNADNLFDSTLPFTREIQSNIPFPYKRFNVEEVWNHPQPTHPSSVPKSFTFIELFAGIGGFRYGLESLGGKCVLTCEINPQARAAYKLNHCGEEKISTDVTCLHAEDIPEFDMLTAGFPCQPFSRLGAQPGMEDKRKGQLFLHVARIARDRQPKWIFLENVPGLVTLHRGATFKLVLRALSKAGYALAFKVVEAAALVPQFRRRVYIIGVRNDLVAPYLSINHQVSLDNPLASKMFKFPRIPHLARTIFGAMERVKAADNLNIANANDENNSRTQFAPGVSLSRHGLPAEKWSKVQQIEIFSQRPHWKVARADRPAGTLVSSYKKGALFNTQFIPVEWSSLGLDETDKAQAIWSNLTKVSHHHDQNLHNNNDILVRFLTEREAARLMGFPENFILPESIINTAHERKTDSTDSNQFSKETTTIVKNKTRNTGCVSDAGCSYALCGNAVCPPVIAILGASLISCFIQNDSLDGIEKNHHHEHEHEFERWGLWHTLQKVVNSMGESEKNTIGTLKLADCFLREVKGQQQLESDMNAEDEAEIEDVD